MGRIRTVGWRLLLGLWATSATAQDANATPLQPLDRDSASRGARLRP